MNCIECRDLFPLRADGSLDPKLAAECAEHLAACATCQAEYSRVSALHAELETRGEPARGVGVVAAVMTRVLSAEPTGRSAPTFRTIVSWFLGAGTIAAAAALLFILTISSPSTNAQVVTALSRGVAAATRLTTVHVTAQMRTPPNDNFSAISPQSAFVPIELWREFDGAKRWRVEKPGRVAAMDGKSTFLFIRSGMAQKIDRPTRAPYDTGWLQAVADIEQTLTSALKLAQTEAARTDLARETAADGRAKAIVTIETVSGLPSNDYLSNRFIGTSNRREVYRFDDASGQLEALQIWLREPEVLIFKTVAIEYNQPLAESTFAIALPANLAWSDALAAPKAAPAKYSTMTPETAARTFFEACGREDWDEVAIFWRGPVDNRIRDAFGGIEVVSIGESFASSGLRNARFVPYTIKFKNGSQKSMNLALKQDAKTRRWFVDGGL